MPDAIHIVDDLRSQLQPTEDVRELDLHRILKRVQRAEGAGSIEAGEAAELRADIAHRLGRYEESARLADRAFGLTGTESAECLMAVARLKSDPDRAVEILRGMLSRGLERVAYACNWAEGLARAGRWVEVPAALKLSRSLVEEGNWGDAHRVAYASAVAGDVPLCASMLKNHLLWRQGDAAHHALDPYTLVVQQRDWLSANSRWFPELTEAVDLMESALREHSTKLSGPLWMNQVYHLVANDDHDAAIDRIYDGIEGMLDVGAIEAVNSLFLWLEPHRLGAEEIVGVLIVTLGARCSLPHRAYFLKQSRPILETEEEGADAVVAGLV